MKSSWKLLGLCCLTAGIVAVSMGQVYAESGRGNVKPIEAVKREDSEVAENIEATEAAVQENTVEKKEESITPSSDEQQVTKAAEDIGVETELKIWDIAYNPETDMVTGKTESGAQVEIVNTNLENAREGIVTADETGYFSLYNPTSGVLRLEATLDGRKSAYYEIDVETPRVEYALRFIYLNYNIHSKTIYGQTAQYATVYVSIPSTGGQAVITADKFGMFTVTDEFIPEMEVVLTAQDAFGNRGKPITYIIPTQAIADSLKIRDVFYDHTTKKLTGKAAPNASISLSILNGGQAMIKADAEGNFVIKDDLKLGSVILISAFLDGVYGETFEYTIPAVPEDKTTKPSGIESTNQPETKSEGKGELPKAGSETSWALSSVGGFTGLGVVYMIFKRKFVGSR